jgi:peptidoglycan hydrolase CwlO-like protein
MNINALTTERDQKIIYLNSTKRFLDEAMRLKAEVESFVRDSEQKLNHALTQVPQNARELAKLREKLEKDQRLYTQSKSEVRDNQAEITKTENEIQRLEQQIQEARNKMSSFTIYRNSKDDSDDEDPHTSRYLPGGRFCIMR